MSLSTSKMRSALHSNFKVKNRVFFLLLNTTCKFTLVAVNLTAGLPISRRWELLERVLVVFWKTVFGTDHYFEFLFVVRKSHTFKLHFILYNTSSST